MSTKQAVIVAAVTAAFAPFTYARGIPPLKRASLLLAEHDAICSYSNHQYFLADDRRLEVVVRQTGALEGWDIRCPGAAHRDGFKSKFSWPPNIEFNQQIYKEQLADLNAAAVKLNYVPFEGEVLVDWEKLEAKGDNGKNTRIKLAAVCSAVSQAIEHKFDAFESLCDSVHHEGMGTIKKLETKDEFIASMLSLLARHMQGEDLPMVYD
ncbi:hypothetical protein FOZ61_005900 [Perkinsus olseni]|uniref:Uncharacterized protein n=1 Tax=Perkinsus olseni TaxID=32597 RepID=A0A7J6LFF2_PEROL|nr:hypothetical protein FOZ61_005900 [Perkinsus olseni]KAF4662119.1 hypothetical protein FOL46_005472 [Perkinsus olseni]